MEPYLLPAWAGNPQATEASYLKLLDKTAAFGGIAIHRYGAWRALRP